MHTNCVLPDETDKNASDVPQGIWVNQSINSYDSGRLTTLIMALKEVLKPASSCFYIHVRTCIWSHSLYWWYSRFVCVGGVSGWGQWMTNWLGFLHNSRSSVHCMLLCVCGTTACGTQPQLNSSDSNVLFACRVQTCWCLSWGHTGCEDDWQGDCNLSHNVPSHTCIYVRNMYSI